MDGNGVLPHFEFNDDLGSALKRYAESVSEARGSIIHNEPEVRSMISTREEVSRSDPDAADELKTAVLSGSIPLVKATLQYVAVDARDPKGRTPLSHAAERGKVEVAKLLLERGATVSIRQWSTTLWDNGCEPHFDSGATAIYWAAKSGHTVLTELLLRHGANPNCRTTSGRTPLQEACKENSFECAKLLLSKNADVNAQSYSDV